MPYFRQLTIDNAISLAKKAVNQGNIDGAEQLYKAILSQNSNHPIAKKGLRRIEKNKLHRKKTVDNSSFPSQEQIHILLSLYNTGQLVQAESACVELLIAYPKSLFIHNLLGAIYNGLGRLTDSLSAFERVIRLDSDNAEAYFNHANVLQAKGEFEKASISYKKAISLKPHYIEALNNLGVALQNLGRFDEAIESYNRVIILEPSYIDAFFNRGVTYQAIGQQKKAIANFNRVIELRPDYIEAHYKRIEILKGQGNFIGALEIFDEAILLIPEATELYINRGNLCFSMKSYQEALDNFEKAISLKSDSVEANFNRGICLQFLGRFEEAIKCYDRVLLLNPDFEEAYYNKGLIYYQQGKPDQAIKKFNQAIRLKPEYSEAYNNRGNAFKEMGDSNEALKNFNTAIELQPEFAEAYNNRGFLLQELGLLEEAVINYNKSLEINPQIAEVYNNRGNALLQQGVLSDAVRSFERALHLKPDFIEAYSNYCMTLNYIPDLKQSELFDVHKGYEKRFFPNIPEENKRHSKGYRKNSRLRIGYVSADFRKHSVAYFFEPLLKSHNNNSVEVYCYYNNSIVDEVTHALRKYKAHWRFINGKETAEVVELIHNDNIDILVDLAGHTAKNRLPVFAYKAAPVQVTWLGYPCTTGLTSIDYRFTDEIADPVGLSDQLHSEQLLRLANGFLCYQGDENIPLNAVLSCKEKGYITFGSFNNLSKVTPQVIQCWSKILLAIPDAHLLLKSKQLADAEVRLRYLRLFEQEGVSGDRIELYSHLAKNDEHLTLYHSIDIGLDPFPYNGTTTTCEALWMGVPIITLNGDHHSSRVGASIMTHVNLEEFIAKDMSEYIELAINFSNRQDYLAELRGKLRGLMLEAELCNAKLFTKNVEKNYHAIWHNYINTH